ncbi:HNH endonuclease [Methylobacterium sp. WL9]|uniref:HNH endonuclease n=1 Tax=Methylobacterium sp. WL9 TaxID=2603898 RepID=UPI0011C7AF48|nr:HNH endonuclease [Methylobacterium sp. WL9]TXN24006.1 HNH endonuclease [Methylobacterium sp. WL9]
MTRLYCSDNSENVGTTRRKPLTASQKLALYDEQKGICPLCGLFMVAGKKLIDEHLRPLGLGGTNDFGNRAIVHEACADAKTHGPRGDIARIADAKAQKRAALGFKTRKGRPMPGSRASGLKRGFDGTVTRR